MNRHWPRMFEEQVRRTPTHRALVDDTVELSYERLNKRANQLARLLVGLGAGPEGIVALVVPRSADAVIAQLAVLKSGAAFMPVDPEYPPDRIAYMLSDAKPVLIVTTATDQPGVPGGAAATPALQGGPIVALDDPGIQATLSALRDSDLADADRNGRLLLGHPAYVIYTSGSTGRPKGVVVTHRGLEHLAVEQIANFGVTERSRVLQFASPSFDAAISELSMALLSGACLVCAAAPQLRPGRPLAEVVARHQITHLTAVPSLLAVMEPDELAPVSTLVVAGEQQRQDRQGRPLRSVAADPPRHPSRSVR